MFNPSVGMKIYDSIWYLRYKLEPEEAADILAEMGVTFVLTQGRLLPMQDSAIESAVTSAEIARFENLDDRKFRDALKSRRIAYFACLNFGFDPAYISTHPELLPIDQFGNRERAIDWYIGLPPDRSENISHKTGLLEVAVKALEPDGIHLGFIRWPGFWETWLPDVERSSMPEYCFGPETLGRFCNETGADLPIDNPRMAAHLIAAQHRVSWRDWKCEMTNRAVRAIRSSVSAIKPDIKIAINTLPFLPTDFDNAVEEVFGQSIVGLGEVTDLFEVMAYHQILRRGTDWPGAIATDVKRRTGVTTVSTVQCRALYTNGMHSKRGRAESISTEEFLETVESVEASEADGICVFTFTDFLDMRGTADGQKRIDRLKRFRN